MSLTRDVIDKYKAQANMEHFSDVDAAVALALRGRPTLSQDKLERVKGVRPLFGQGKTLRDLKNSTTYKTGADMQFAICRNPDMAFLATSQNDAEILVVLRGGLKINHDIQLATLAEVYDGASISVIHKNQEVNWDRLPPDDFLWQGLRQAGAKVDMASGAGTDTYGADAWIYEKLSRDDPLPGHAFSEPLVIDQGERALIQLDDLSGTIAGTSPAFKARPFWFALMLELA